MITVPAAPALRLPSSAPGLLLCAAGAAVALILGHAVGVAPLLLAILLGVALANTVLRREGAATRVLAPGTAVAAKNLLRVGVALLGLQLLVPDVLALGWGTLAVAVAVVALGIAGTLWLGARLGLGWTQRLLIACGFSICGAAAAAAVDGMISARTRELVTTVALVVVFGTAMIPLLPMLASGLGLDGTQAGMWAGAAVHEVAQVVAVGGALDNTAVAGAGGALTVAVTVKLARVALLAPVAAGVGIAARRRGATPANTRRPPLVPLFLVGFLACAALRATGILPAPALEVAHSVQVALLAAAMFALGTGVRLDMLRGIGWRPVALAGFATVWVTVIALAGVLLVHPLG